MIGYLMLAAQATGVVVTPAPPPAPPRTTRSETVPAFELTCALVDDKLAAHRLALRQTGGRGYTDPESGFPRRSRIIVSVYRDDTKLFSGGGRLIGDSDGYRVTRIEGSHPQQGAVKLETVHAGRNKLAAMVSVNALAEIKYTGFCDQVRRPQSPLTGAETREYLKR